jgi:hypothetical protein
MKLRTQLAAAAAIALAWATPALATTITITSAPYSPDSTFGGILIGNPAYNGGGEAGRFAVSGFEVGAQANTFNAFTYCIDVFKAVFTSTDYNISPLSAIGASVDRQSRLAGLLVNSAMFYNGAATAAERKLIAAATQLSVWELIYETAGASLTVGSGNFSVFGDFTPATASRADAFLASNWTASPTLVSSLISVGGQSQNQIYLNSLVPEPATWLSMLFGFGIVGSAMRRAKLRRAAVV